MKLTRNLWFTIAGIVLLVGGATLAVFFWSSQSPHETNSTQLAPTQESSRIAETTDADHDSPTNNEQKRSVGKNSEGLDFLTGHSNDFDRNLALYLYLSELDGEQLGELIDETRDLAPFIRLNAQRVILERLTSIDPLAALSLTKNLQPSLMTTVFVQWSRTDVNDAIAHAKTLDFSRKSAALRGILTSRNDLPEDILRQIGKELDNERLAQSIINSSKIKDYLKTPAESWRAIIGEAQHDPSQVGILDTLARTWFEEEGISVIEDIHKSLTNNHTRNYILSSVLQMAVDSDPRGSFELALDLSQGTDASLVEPLTQIWASADPEAALDAVSALSPSRLNRQLLSSVLRSWSDDDPHALLEKVEGLSDEVRAMGQELAIRAIARDRPDQAATLIARMDDGSSKRRAARAVASSWIGFEPNAALDWILSDLGIANYREELLTHVLPSLAADSPQLAFDTALAQPIEDGKPGLETSVILSLAAQNNLNMALEMLPRVREGKSKTGAYAMIGSMLVAKDNPQDAMELAQQLPESDRETYFLITMGSWAQSDPSGLLGKIEELPSTAAKSKAAAMLTFMHRFDEKKLTDSQIKEVGKFLSDEDAESLQEGGMSLLNPILNMGLEL